MRRLLPWVVLALGCEPFGAPNQSHEQKVEGCNEAVAHLRSCCPAWDSYISCTYLDNAVAVPDLSPGESRCITAKPCDQIASTVEGGHYLCGKKLNSRSCR